MRSLKHSIIAIMIGSILAASSVFAAPVEKEWTLLVFLNGKNNLDSFGKLNINQMEKIGSTEKINLVVQWGSLKNGTTQRLYVEKDNQPDQVTSPVVQDVGNVDMGDWKSLVEFVKWGAENYPAKRYFVDVWDHGSGWHMLNARQAKNPSYGINDISWDDITGNFMTTEQLAQALEESAQIIGHKVDLYGSDACLMSMAEVADQMSGSVSVFAGSEEVEPAQGWPYNTFLERWVQSPGATPQEVGAMLTEAYLQAYSGGQYGTRSVTFSIFDLAYMDQFNSAVRQLSQTLLGLGVQAQSDLVQAARNTQSFAYSDYGDLGDFVHNLEIAGISELDTNVLLSVQDAIQKLVTSNATSPRYSRSQGIAIWLPSNSYQFDRYANRYMTMEFHKNTGWGDTLRSFFHASR